LNALLEPTFLPLVFHPIDGNFSIAFLDRPAATSAAERHVRKQNAFGLYWEDGEVIHGAILQS
jgi:hypothetical protein